MTISASTVTARATHQANASVDQMTIGKSPDQLQGICRITDLEIQVTQTVFSIKTEVAINKQGLTNILTGNTHLIIIIISHPP